MTAVLSYSAARFNALPSLSVASDAFAPRKKGALPRLVAIIHAAGLAEVAGVALLHGHFTVVESERLIHGQVRSPRHSVLWRLPYLLVSDVWCNWET